MKERPILFSVPMVRAILDGRKNQTRRIAKVTDEGCRPGFLTPLAVFVPRSIDSHAKYCPYGKIGDHLWVRETWSKAKHSYSSELFYRADGECNGKQTALSFIERESRWRPSIYMPRWASRILLEITNVRVERLNEISEEDAIAEGIKNYENGCYGLDDPDSCMVVKPSIAYMRLWNHINGQGSWDLNPWVWCLTFRIIK